MGAVRSALGVFGTRYVVGSLCGLFYRAHGNIVDWMYKRAGIKYSYAVHLRDTGTVSCRLFLFFLSERCDADELFGLVYSMGLRYRRNLLNL